ncbi:MAG: hypothetical protein J0H54_00925 [Rhizobiales bacterium]|nr:hypothetical protein [Hyphomicrobiales bacterium]
MAREIRKAIGQSVHVEPLFKQGSRSGGRALKRQATRPELKSAIVDVGPAATIPGCSSRPLEASI